MGRLTGLRIVVTRAAEQAEELARPLREAGAVVILLPAIAIAPARDLPALRAAARELSQYDWLLLTSGNAANAFLTLVDMPALTRRPKLAVVGKATRQRALSLGWKEDLAPQEFTAEALADCFDLLPVTGERFLMPGGDLARDVLSKRLCARGAVVDVVEAYRTVMPPETAERAQTLFAGNAVPDWVTLASPSAVENLAQAVGVEALRRTRLASIGPATSAAVKANGLDVATEAREHTAMGLVEALG
jgi:uroporphyrinogen-III synthase